MSAMPDPPARPPLTPPRMVFAVLGILIMVFSGGCSIFVLANPAIWELSLWGLVALFGGMPFAAGLLIWFLAVKVGRG